MRSVLGKALMLGLAVAATSVAGCSSNDKPSTSGNTTGATGDIGLQLQVGGTTVNSVHYRINNNAANAANGNICNVSTQGCYEGDLSVADASSLLAVIGGIAAGDNYVLTLHAVGTNGTPCDGTSAPFTVVANSTVIVGIQLLCRAANDAGSVKIEGTTAECANFGSIGAAVPNGNQIQITTTTIPASPVPAPVFAWTGGSPGGLSSTSAANPVYTCNGTETEVHLDLLMSQGSTAVCNQTFHLIIDCPTGGGTGGTGGGAGTGGTAGTGGAGGATGGAAGATGGAAGATGGAAGATGGAAGATGGAAGATGGAAGATGGAAGATGGAAGATGGAGGTGGGTATCDQDCQSCVNDNDPSFNDCTDITGNIATGPATGQSNQTLCSTALQCFHDTRCAEANGAIDCYCGTLTLGACQSVLSTATNAGPCFSQLNAAMGLPDGSTGSYVLDRLNVTSIAGGLATWISTVEGGGCPTECFPYTPTGTCTPALR